jgi:hypothetical protein
MDAENVSETIKGEELPTRFYRTTTAKLVGQSNPLLANLIPD